MFGGGGGIFGANQLLDDSDHLLTILILLLGRYLQSGASISHGAMAQNFPLKN